MGLNVALVTFNPATLIKSSDVNTNFANLNNTTQFFGGMTKMNFEAGKVVSDGSGSIKITNGQIGLSAAGDMIDSSGALDVYFKATSATGTIDFVVASVLTVRITATSLAIMQGNLKFNVGSIQRISTFTGSTAGTYNHGNNGIPDICMPICTVSGQGDGDNFDSATPVAVHISTQNGRAFKCLAMAF